MASPQLPYRDRAEGGQVLAGALRRYAGREGVVVLGLPRGGVVTAYAVAEKLKAPLDVLIVRKLGLPGQEELAMGAIASGGARVLNPEVVRGLSVPEEVIESVTRRESQELARREREYRGARAGVELSGKCVILVDDGLATGSTMLAAVRAVKQLGPSEVVVAVPVAPPETVKVLASEADEVVCPAQPWDFRAVGQWYQEFGQTSDDEVKGLLSQAWSAKSGDVGHG